MTFLPALLIQYNVNWDENHTNNFVAAASVISITMFAGEFRNRTHDACVCAGDLTPPPLTFRDSLIICVFFVVCVWVNFRLATTS